MLLKIDLKDVICLSAPSGLSTKFDSEPNFCLSVRQKQSFSVSSQIRIADIYSWQMNIWISLLLKTLVVSLTKKKSSHIPVNITADATNTCRV